ncbi:sigma-E processing peptidase SpoIIGA [Lysinibacillus sp. 54212]|uniref:sigma-E processing peptidase SpoIIGA n=1 Tax=Lysinibacillus sp. 54212 TaxID=3119829 RepID=UPI002FCC369C
MIGEWLVLISTLFNYLLLRFTQDVTQAIGKKWRLLLSAFVSSVIAIGFYPSKLALILSFVVLIGTAFQFKRAFFLKQGFVLLCATFLLGGLLNVVQTYAVMNLKGSYFLIIVVIASLSLLLIKNRWVSLWKDNLQQKFKTKCDIRILDCSLNLDAFIDTGNECIEPISRQPVHFLSLKATSQYLPSSLLDALNDWKQEEPFNISMFPKKVLRTIRFVSITTVQQKSLYVLAFRCDAVTLNDKTFEGHYIVFTQNDAKFPQQADIILHFSMLPTS